MIQEALRKMNGEAGVLLVGSNDVLAVSDPAPLPSAHLQPTLGALPKPGVLDVGLHAPLCPLVPVSLSAPGRLPALLGPHSLVPLPSQIPAVEQAHTHSRPHTSTHALCPDPHAPGSALPVP